MESLLLAEGSHVWARSRPSRILSGIPCIRIEAATLTVHSQHRHVRDHISRTSAAAWKHGGSFCRTQPVLSLVACCSLLSDGRRRKKTCRQRFKYPVRCRCPYEFPQWCQIAPRWRLRTKWEAAGPKRSSTFPVVHRTTPGMRRQYQEAKWRRINWLTWCTRYAGNLGDKRCKLIIYSLKTQSCHDAKFVGAGGTGGCRYDGGCRYNNIRRHQWRQS